MLKLKTDFTKIQKTLAELTEQTGQNLWYKVASRVYTTIVKNIQKGVDVNGVSFTEYTPSYKKYRTKQGLGLKVNLQLSSNMFRSITIEADENGFVIFVSGYDNNNKAQWVQDKGRVFLDWGTETIRAFEKAIEREINDVFRE